MYTFKVGDIVARKSYGNDIHFVITGINKESTGKTVCVLRGLLYRIQADAEASDLIRQNPIITGMNIRKSISYAKRAVNLKNTTRCWYNFNKRIERPGKILHIDSSREFLDVCIRHYRQARINCSGYLAAEDEQPGLIKNLLERNKPDIIVITGHDGIKKGSLNLDSLDNYRNSKYYVQSVREARKYQPDYDKLCIFAGACQSYYEAIMNAGANFASSPGRILINCLDPAIVSEKVSLTDSETIVSPKEVSELTISGSDGIGGIDTKGRLVRQ